MLATRSKKKFSLLVKLSRSLSYSHAHTRTYTNTANYRNVCWIYPGQETPRDSLDKKLISVFRSLGLPWLASPSSNQRRQGGCRYGDAKNRPNCHMTVNGPCVASRKGNVEYLNNISLPGVILAFSTRYISLLFFVTKWAGNRLLPVCVR